MSLWLLFSSVTLIELPVQANFPAAQLDRFCNVVRYIDFLQNTLGTTNLFEPVKIKKPSFNVPSQSGVLAKVGSRLLNLGLYPCTHCRSAPICCKALPGFCLIL